MPTTLPVREESLRSSAALADRLRIPGRAVWGAIQVGGFALLTALAAQAQVRVPGLTVPFTLQSLVVLTAGMLLTPWRAFAAMAAYLVAGSALIGLGSSWQAFTPGSVGIAGPTGGYLVGFLAAAPMVSWLAGEGRRGTLRLTLAGVCGTLVIFACGVAWLARFPGGWAAAMTGGALPFGPESALKLAGAVSMVRAGGSVVNSVRAARRSCGDDRRVGGGS